MTLTNLINVKWTLLIHYILLERIFLKTLYAKIQSREDKGLAKSIIVSTIRKR